MPDNTPQLTGVHLNWTVERVDRTFRVYTVEPDVYAPQEHGAVFDAALRALISPRLARLEISGLASAPTMGDRFDLATFPEAFLPQAHLLNTLAGIADWPPIGCVHVGLRPDSTGIGHLFSVEQLNQLIQGIRTLPDAATEDVEEFERWLGTQHHTWMFNVGCVFAVDVDHRLRICLHPKNVRSNIESSALPENNMKEAGFISLITLHTPGGKHMSVTLQPLLCSDALELSTDTGDPGPIEAASQHPDLFMPHPPDHIDVVSVATCTPQPRVTSGKGQSWLEWHEQFRNTFQRAATSPRLHRHRFASFVLSNFRTVSEKEGGLSGVFIPARLRDDNYERFIVISCWGRPDEQSPNSWSPPLGSYEVARNWESLGYLAYLDRQEDRLPPTGRILGFTLHRFPRDMHPVIERTGLTGCTQWIGEFRPEDPSLIFAEPAHA